MSELDRAWLEHRLQHTDPAEREVLVDYVQALLRHAEHDDARLESKLHAELSDFLADQTSAFVTDLLAHLQGRGAGTLGSAAAPLLDSDAAVPDAPDQPASAQHAVPTQAPAQAPAQPQPSGTGSSRPCRNFHQRGYCARGDECKFSHAPVVSRDRDERDVRDSRCPSRGRSRSPGRDAGRGPASVSTGGPPASSRGEYRTPAPLPGRPESSVPGGIRIGATIPYAPRGELARRLGPDQQPYSQQYGQSYSQPYARPDQRHFERQGGHKGDRPLSERPDWAGGRGDRFERPERDTYRRRGGVDFDLSAYDPDASIVVEQVPVHALNDGAVWSAFAPYGDVEAITLDAEAKRALVVFAAPDAARRAHDDPAGFFESRFVRVFYADGRDRPGQGQGQGPGSGYGQMDRHRPSGHTYAQRGRGGRGRGGGSGAFPPFRGAGPGSGSGPGPFPHPHPHPGAQPSSHPRAYGSSGGLAAQVTSALGAAATATVEAKTASMRVEALLGEQKRLMGSLMGSPAPAAEEKKATMVRLRDLAAQIPPATEAAKHAQEAAAAARAEAARVKADAAQAHAQEQEQTQEQEQKQGQGQGQTLAHEHSLTRAYAYGQHGSALSERDRLDAELDAMAADRT